MSKKHIVISVPGYEDYSSTSKQEELVKYLSDVENQEDLIILEDKLKSKKLAAV